MPRECLTFQMEYFTCGSICKSSIIWMDMFHLNLFVRLVGFGYEDSRLEKPWNFPKEKLGQDMTMVSIEK